MKKNLLFCLFSLLFAWQVNGMEEDPREQRANSRTSLVEAVGNQTQGYGALIQDIETDDPSDEERNEVLPQQVQTSGSTPPSDQAKKELKEYLAQSAFNLREKSRKEFWFDCVVESIAASLIGFGATNAVAPMALYSLNLFNFPTDGILENLVTYGTLLSLYIPYTTNTGQAALDILSSFKSSYKIPEGLQRDDSIGRKILEYSPAIIMSAALAITFYGIEHKKSFDKFLYVYIGPYLVNMISKRLLLRKFMSGKNGYLDDEQTKKNRQWLKDCLYNKQKDFDSADLNHLKETYSFLSDSTVDAGVKLREIFSTQQPQDQAPYQEPWYMNNKGSWLTGGFFYTSQLLDFFIYKHATSTILSTFSESATINTPLSLAAGAGFSALGMYSENNTMKYFYEMLFGRSVSGDTKFKKWARVAYNCAWILYLTVELMSLSECYPALAEGIGASSATDELILALMVGRHIIFNTYYIKRGYESFFYSRIYGIFSQKRGYRNRMRSLLQNIDTKIDSFSPIGVKALYGLVNTSQSSSASLQVSSSINGADEPATLETDDEETHESNVSASNNQLDERLHLLATTGGDRETTQRASLSENLKNLISFGVTSSLSILMFVLSLFFLT